jgi:hypothetical protein
MILKRISIYIIFCLHFSINFAQSVEWSNPQKIKSKTGYSQIVGESASGIYLLRCKDNSFSRDVIIEKYKSNLAQELSIPMPININGILERVLLFDNTIYVFVSAKNNVSNKIDLLLQKLDENLKPIGNAQVLISMNSEEIDNKTHFYIKHSSEKKFIGVMFLSNRKEKNNSNLNLFCFDGNMQQQYGKQYDLPYSIDDIFITSYDMGNEGECYLLIDYPKSGVKKKGSDSRSFFLYSYSLGMDKMLEYEVGQSDVFIEEIGMCLNNYSKKISVTGFYSKDNSKKVSGYFYYVLDLASNELITKRFETFPLDFISKRYNTKGTDDLSDLYIRKMVARSDGGCLLLAEKYYLSRQTYTYYVNGFPQTNSRTVYNYDDVQMMSFNADGSLQFNNTISKSQSSISDGGYYSSIVPIITAENLYVVYNNDVSTEGDMMLSYANNKGLIENKILVKAINTSALIIPSETKQVGSNSILACSLRDKRFTLMRITF